MPPGFGGGCNDFYPTGYGIWQCLANSDAASSDIFLTAVAIFGCNFTCHGKLWAGIPQVIIIMSEFHIEISGGSYRPQSDGVWVGWGATKCPTPIPEESGPGRSDDHCAVCHLVCAGAFRQ
jgi:hypothetical protein